MDEKTASANVSAEPAKTASASEKVAVVPASAAATGRAESEHRQVYGTAKTENLRDSGLWRLILPAAVVVFCITLSLYLYLFLSHSSLILLRLPAQGEKKVN